MNTEKMVFEIVRKQTKCRYIYDQVLGSKLIFKSKNISTKKDKHTLLDQIKLSLVSLMGKMP